MFLRTSLQAVCDVERSHVVSLDVSQDVVRRSKSSVSKAVGSTRLLLPRSRMASFFPFRDNFGESIVFFLTFFPPNRHEEGS